MDGASRGSASWSTLLRNVRERMGGAPGAPGAPPAQSAPPTAAPPAVRVPPADAAGSSDEAFPQVSDAQLRALFPGVESDTTSESQCVRAALVEMELAYKMDRGLLGSKSDAHRGYAAMAAALARAEALPRGGSARRRAAEADEAAPSAGGAGSERRPSRGTWQPRARPYAIHDVYAAIDRRDLETLGAIRDAHFSLLLGPDVEAPAEAGAKAPLEYAIGLGPRWEGTVIMLVGAMSRFVNRLPDDFGAPHRASQSSEEDARTAAVLRKVRANLKLALDQSVRTDQTALLASYLQVLVMAEGTVWIEHTVTAVARELRTCGGTRDDRLAALPRPVQMAKDAVLHFLTSNMRTRRGRDELFVAAVNDFVDNAAGDLVLMALWEQLRSASLSGAGELQEPLPPYAFARDERITQLFLQRVEARAHEPRPHDVHHAHLWQAALRIDEALQTPLRRRSAAERLALLEQLFDQHT